MQKRLQTQRCLECLTSCRRLQSREQFKTTSIVITHDLTCAKVTGDRMAVLLDGQFKAVGTFNEVFADADDQRVKSFYDYNFIES